MIEVLDSSLVGNVIELISLLIGFAGLIITVITMKSARRIEQDISNEKAIAIDKNNFNNFKFKTIKTLNKKRTAVSKAGVVSSQSLINIRSILNDLKIYENILEKEDNSKLKKMFYELSEIIDKKRSKTRDVSTEKFDDIVSDIINILNRGVYGL